MNYVNVCYKCARCGAEVTHCVTTQMTDNAPLTGMPSFLTHQCDDGSTGVCAPWQVTPTIEKRGDAELFAAKLAASEPDKVRVEFVERTYLLRVFCTHADMDAVRAAVKPLRTVGVTVQYCIVL